MFSTLPDFTPRDTHSLWYISSRNPSIPVGVFDGLPADHSTTNHGQNSQSRHRSGQVLERTALARLAADETYLQRRRLNVQNFGSGWLRPPGIAKTLHQMREEKREQEEHQEAMRRERLAQELAEAEAEAAAETMEDEQGMMDDVQLDGAQDLDDDIPDADDDFALGGDSDEEEPEDEEEEEAQPESEDDELRREERQNDLMAARMQMADDAFRQALVRGETGGDDMYGGEEELEEEDQGHMLGEDDFADSGNYVEDGYDDLGMDGDLDDDIPEAESGMYEHTDSEAELSSSAAAPASEDGGGVVDEEDIGFAPRTAPLGPPQSPTLGVRSRRSTNASAGRASMDLSAFLSQDESSFMDSSPVQRRRQ